MPTRRAFLESSFGGALLAVGGGTWARRAPANGRARLAAGGFRGEIVTPGSSRYDEMRRMFVHNPRRRASPSLIAACSNEDDVRCAIDFGRSERLELAVRAGGHDLQAASICDGLVIDLAPLRHVDVNPVARTVRVGAGVRAGTLNAALAQHDLAAALGCAGNVGVTGLTLSGGLGWLVGRHGAACDHLLAARLVTSDGRLLRVDADHHPELLWALRGGGGNFGVVTELTLRVHPRPPVTQGTIVLRAGRIADFLRRYRDYLAAAGDDVDLETYIFAPRGEALVFIKACYAGDHARAEDVLAPLRRLGALVADDLATSPYAGVIDPTGSVAQLLQPPPTVRQADDAPGLHVGALSMAPLSDESAEAIAASIAEATGSWIFGIAHFMHGAALRATPDVSPMRRLAGHITSYFIASWRRQTQAEQGMAWVDRSMTALQPHAAPTYVNYITEDGHDAVRRAYGESYSRLAAIKHHYDPDNMFHRNRNILPSRT